MSESVKDELQETVEKLNEIQVDELTDEDLEDVAGGCSSWCCSDGRAISER